jgi:2-amino-4-hydroxy-6-hydroxymethyldihydropteridine diphosphokinase
MHERAFVLVPLVELDPALVIPDRGRASDLLTACAGQRVERLPD